MTFVCLSGLPRTGSTLLSALLSQNPEVHAEGNSAVCQLMWDMQQSCEGAASEQLAASRRYKDQDALISSIPAIYYRHVKTAHIVDKCRSWTLPANMAMLRRYVTDDPKVIVMTRPLDEIVDSFVRLRVASGWQGNPESQLLTPGSEPIMRSLEGVEYARAHNKGEFLFIEYASLIDDTHAILDAIYAHCDWKPFRHNITHVINRHPEDDTVYGLIGMHDIRQTVGVK